MEKSVCEMEDREAAIFVMIPSAELEAIKLTLQKILNQLLLSKIPVTNLVPFRTHLTALEYMKAVSIKRTKFDELVANGKISIIKKKRKIYVRVEEVDRYFKDISIK